jgi:RHS repeat-associated protein
MNNLIFTTSPSSKYYLKQWTIVLLAMTLLPMLMKGQTPNINPTPNVIPPAPNVATLSKFGDVPVSGYTGVPNIGIDFKPLGGTKLSVPIGIKYHAGGIRVNDISTVVGLSWALSAGGSISRTVKGLPDDGPGGYLTFVLPNPLSPSQITSNNLNLYEGAAKGENDLEPDMFSFNFGSYSGKFVFDANKNIKLIPYQNIKIAPSSDYNSWIVTTPDGTIYSFGGIDAIDASSINKGNGNLSSYNSAWHLTSIQSPNKDDVINLTYETYNSISSQKGFSRDFADQRVSNSPCPVGGNPVSSNTSIAISAKSIRTISSINGKVVFTYAACTDWNINKKLSTITYYGNDLTTILNSYSLEQGYYVSSGQNRLRLDKVREIGSDGSTSPPYEFTYLNSGNYILPTQQSFAQDHWGFYNGADANTTLLPEILTNVYTSAQIGAERNPSREYTKAGIIQKVTYPTGGYTTFDFECHEFNGSDNPGVASELLTRRQSTESIAGGLRVKEIKSFDGSQTNVKKYVYKSLSNSAVSSGVLLSPVSYSYTSYIYTVELAGCPSETECLRYGQASSSSVPLSLGQGSHVVYPEVTEYLGQNGEFGKTEYSYSNPSDNFSLNYNIPAITSYDWGRGLLTKKEDYSYLSNSYIKVQKMENFYNMRENETINNSKIDGLIIRYFKKPNCPIVSGPNTDYTPWFQWRGYSNISRWFYLDSSRVTLFDLAGASPLTTTTVTKYRIDGVHTFPIETNVKNSNNVVTINKTYYADDLTSSTNHPNFSIKQEFINRYMIGVPLRTEQITGTSIVGSVLEYQKFNNDNLRFFPYKYHTINKDGSLFLEVTINDYDNNLYKGMPTQVTKTEFGVSDIYSWNNKKQLIGKSVNVTPTSPALLSMVFTYKTATNLVESITDENGLIKKFYYDGLMRLQKVDDRMRTDGTDIQATTNYTYQYKDANNPYSYVGTSSSFKGVATNLITKQYMDGLGRPIEVVKEGYTPNSNLHQKNYVSYDALGRQNKAYLPFEGSTLGVELPPAYTSSFVLTEFEASPLSRPIKQTNVDYTTVETTYGSNLASDQVWNLSASGGNGANILGTSFYTDNALYKTTLKDENGKLSCVLKDKLGRVILTRKFLGTDKVDTYNVYDDYGQLVAVLPPGSVTGTTTASISNTLTFQYKYNTQGLLIEKKIPGADPQKYYYDKRNLLTLTQDGNMVTQNRYLGTQYDNIGRVEKTGWVSTATAADPITYAASGFLIPNDANKLTETIYYPNKNWVKHQGAKVLDPANPNSMNFVWSYVERRVGYEYTGNPIWTGKQHLLNGTLPNRPITDDDGYGVDWSASAYNGMQQPEYTLRYMYGNADNGTIPTRQVRTRTDFFYDNGRRLINMKYTYALDGEQVSAPIFTLSNMVYNYKDQLTEKNIGLNGSNALQSIDYTYNLRGWLTDINGVSLSPNPNYTQMNILTPSSTGAGAIQNLAITPLINQAIRENIRPKGENLEEAPPVADTNDLFSETINYNDLDSRFGAPPQYNGNISAVTWQVAGRAKQGYGYKYDDLDRLTEANYFDINDGNASGVPYSKFLADNKFQEKQTYDLRGNIMSLQRNGLNSGAWTSNGYTAATYGTIDNLEYKYNSQNQLIKLKDYSISDRGFKTVTPAPLYNPSDPDHYLYDKNGNLTQDLNKGTTNIVYDASGAKLRKITNNNGTIDTYDYVNGVEYKNTILQRFAHTEGAVVNQGDNITFMHEYVLRDHLGNTRVTFTDADNNGIVAASDIKQINNYYPFGLNMEGNWNGAEGSNKYQYNGKQWNDDFGLGWNDYGARFYDPAVARWWSVDPEAESGKQPSWNPYHYVFDNPIKNTDPDGREPDEDGGKKKKVSNAAKGMDQGLTQRYQIEPARGDTKTGIRDTKAGRVSKATGKPVGEWVVRADQAHAKAPVPHINVNPKMTGVPDPHTAIVGGEKTLKGLEMTGKSLDAIGKFAKPVAIITDVVRIGDAINSDGGKIGNNTIQTTASVAGGWAGASFGAQTGGATGAYIGSFFGPGPGTAVGGFVGAIIGGVAGSFGGSWAGEKAAQQIIEK